MFRGRRLDLSLAFSGDLNSCCRVNLDNALNQDKGLGGKLVAVRLYNFHIFKPPKFRTPLYVHRLL